MSQLVVNVTRAFAAVVHSTAPTCDVAGMSQTSSIVHTLSPSHSYQRYTLTSTAQQQLLEWLFLRPPINRSLCRSIRT